MTLLQIFLLALVVRLLTQLWLDHLNKKEVQRNSEAIPKEFAGVMDDETYAKSVRYTLAKHQFGVFETIVDAVILGVIILCGVLPWFYTVFSEWVGRAAWASAFFLVVVSMLMSVLSLPLEWWSQFKIEAKFGFNRSSLGLWGSDKLKGAVIGLIIGFPLLWLLFKLVDWIGPSWWVWGFVLFFCFQLLMMILYPMLIMPLFNKLTPLPEGSLKDRLMALAESTAFKASTIQVMDGSKRSSHSNAFFTGFGRFRRIVLFDTLIDQLEESELAAVLAHEIGHYKRGHIPKMLMVSSVMTLVTFWLVDYLSRSAWFFEGFGFSEASLPVAFLLFMLLSGLFTFWVSPLFSQLSRKHEYEADSFAVAAVGDQEPMVSSLQKLSEKNLSNLTPHPLYSAFHYSHPTLLERERAIRALPK